MFKRLDLRQTTGQRVFNATLVVGGIGILVAKLFPERGAPFWIAASVAVVLVALYLWRMLGIRVIAEGDRLVVHNLWWTTRLHRSGIEAFRVGGILRPPFRTVKVTRRSGGAVEIDVFLSFGLTRSMRRRRVDAVGHLSDWLDEIT